MTTAIRTPHIRSAVTSLPPYVAGRRATSNATASLASNENHFPPLPSVLDEIAWASGRINRYPDSAAEALRERIAAHVGVRSDEVAAGPGSVGVLQQIIASVCDAGDEVVFAWRSFEAYPLLVTLAGARPVPVPLTRHETHDLDAMAAAITPRTRLVLLCTPNNPTGVTIAGADLDRFLARVPGDVLVVIDEAYLEYVTTDPLDALARYRRYPNVCLLRTFSKAYGLAGLRVGYAIASPTVTGALRRTGLPFAVSSLAQAAAIASLDASRELAERVAAVATERDRVTCAMRRLGLAVPGSQANFVWLRTGEGEREAVLRAFDAADILVRGYAGDGVRITIADAASNDRVLQALAELQRAAA